MTKPIPQTRIWFENLNEVSTPPLRARPRVCGAAWVLYGRAFMAEGVDHTVPLTCIFGQVSERRLPPMLTTEELQAIQAAAPSPTVKRLLWDIFQLRIVARRANQIADHLGNRQPPPMDTLLGALREELEALTFLEEDRRREDRILNGHGEKRKPKGANNH